ncbi:spermatogenesis-associated protein 2-like protein isoform X1 [Anguilla anguilla]|uniref:spermatogenesis-associated protein 2-like protein isoform X1 n=1 Tax=Anguilla anguilla TaxID=7936 RepID=UPI0015ABC6D5|nr:spermatogenesis-associated protein 2-like protein isoform X1 [Anguilla anguilla]
MESLTQNQRSKNGTREFCHLKFGRSSRGVCEQYRVSLERRIAQGDIDLVCGDEELCQRVEGMLKEGDPRDVLTVRDLDILAVMEDSLKAPPDWGRTVGGLKGPATVPGLGAISKAFEVLERAALNLYLCPWRKEYRVVKIFSGIFTHLLRPALSEQQVVHLFGLLGYQAKEAELELRGPPPSAATLLGLACAFFAARCESRLLSAAAAASSGGPGAELTLVQERRKGHSLQGALESLRKAGESSWGYTEQADLDLYTADGEGLSGETEAASAGQKLSTAFEDREGASSLPAGGSSNSVSASSLRVSITLKSQQSAARSLEPERQPAVSRTAGDGVMVTEPEQNQTCTCYCTPCSLYYCQQCSHVHSIICDISDSCRKNNHNLELISDPALSGPSKVGASSEPWKESSAGKAFPSAWDISKEGRASTALSEELKVGSETGLDRPKEGGASAAPVEQTGESRASRTLRPELGLTCDRQDCKNLCNAFCKSCNFKICHDCWLYKQTVCACGGTYCFRMSSSV